MELGIALVDHSLEAEPVLTLFELLLGNDAAQVLAVGTGQCGPTEGLDAQMVKPLILPRKTIDNTSQTVTPSQLPDNQGACCRANLTGSKEQKPPFYTKRGLVFIA